MIIVSTGVVSLPPRFGAAIESYTYDLAKILSRRGYRVDLVADTNVEFDLPRVSVTPVGTGSDRYLEPVPLRAMRRPLSGYLTARATLGLLQSDGQSDRTVVVLNEEVSAALVARRLRRLKHVRSIFVVHDPPPELGLTKTALAETSVRRLAWGLTRIAILRNVSALVTLNPRVTAYVSSTTGIPAQSCFSLPLAIDTDAFAPKSQEKRPGECRIAYVGRIDSRKNVDLLVRAMEMTEEGTTLRLVGDGPMRKPLERWVADHRMGKRVRFLGVTSPEELRGVLQSSDAFVLASSLEVFPRAALEAASCGLPLILPQRPQYDQYFGGKCAQGFDDFNPTSIAAAMISLASSPERRSQLGNAARNFAIRFCGYDAIGHGLDDIFEYCWTRDS